MWKIIYSDHQSDIYEANLMRRLTGLLYLDPKTVGDIKEKVRLKSEEEDITINGFIQFYTNLVNIEEKAKYVRKQTKPDDRSYQPRNQGKHLNLHHASIKPIGQNNRWKNHGCQNQLKITPPIMICLMVLTCIAMIF